VRILGFSKHWAKLEQKEFSTFRLRRRDRDWQDGELVQVVYKPRSKSRERLGIAEIISKEPRCLLTGAVLHCRRVTFGEAIEDGFSSLTDMENWMLYAHGDRAKKEPLNKLTLRWVDS